MKKIRIRYGELFENSKYQICGNCVHYNPYYVKANGKEYLVHLGQCECERKDAHASVCPGKFPACKNWKGKTAKVYKQYR